MDEPNLLAVTLSIILLIAIGLSFWLIVRMRFDIGETQRAYQVVYREHQELKATYADISKSLMDLAESIGTCRTLLDDVRLQAFSCEERIRELEEGLKKLSTGWEPL